MPPTEPKPKPRPPAKTPGEHRSAPKVKPPSFDPNLYPGMVEGERTTAYTTWLRNVPPEFHTLISRFGAPVQALLWRANQDGREPNDVLNEITFKYGADAFKSGGGGGGGRGRGGGGGGGGVQPPTPEQIAAAKAEITNRSRTLGHTPLSEDVLLYVATTAVRDNWNSAQLDDWLLGDEKAITDPGAVTVSIDQIKSQANAQLMNVSDATAREWAMRINSGEMDAAAVQSIFQQQATAEFGWAAQSLAGGLTMRDILMPARDTLARELEMSGDSIDLMDPKWRNMTIAADEKGVPRAATMTEVTKAARKDPAYAKTAGAARFTANIAQQLRQVFEGG